MKYLVAILLTLALLAPAHGLTKVKRYVLEYDRTFTLVGDVWRPVASQRDTIEMKVGATILRAVQGKVRGQVVVFAEVNTQAEFESVEWLFLGTNVAAPDGYAGEHALSFHFGRGRKNGWLHLYKRAVVI